MRVWSASAQDAKQVAGSGGILCEGLLCSGRPSFTQLHDHSTILGCNFETTGIEVPTHIIDANRATLELRPMVYKRERL